MAAPVLRPRTDPSFKHFLSPISTWNRSPSLHLQWHRPTWNRPMSEEILSTLHRRFTSFEACRGVLTGICQVETYLVEQPRAILKTSIKLKSARSRRVLLVFKAPTAEVYPRIAWIWDRVSSLLRNVYTIQPVVQPVVWTTQMSAAKRRLSGPARMLMTSLGWRAQQGCCVDSRRCGAFDRFFL